jgi:imidazolonepropionase-like amidohydrolase
VVTVEARGVVVRGRVWPGDASAYDGWVAVGADGLVAATGNGEPDVVSDIRVIGDPTHWVGHGIVDAHVHLAFGSPQDMLRAGVVAVRDLGAPPNDALRWQREAELPVAVAGPLLTAPGGYPSNSWGANGFARFVGDSADAREAVHSLAAAGVDIIKLALEPAAGQPVPGGKTARAIVAAAHERGLAVTCHALTGAMVERALDVGVDELCHTPVERLGERLVQGIAAADVAVVTTLQTLVDGGTGDGALDNASALHAAGVRLVYGTDLGNAGTRPGAEPRELGRLVAAGMSPVEALQSATVAAASMAGLRGRVPGVIRVGTPAHLVVLRGDPLVDFEWLRDPVAVVIRDRVVGW